MVAHFVKSVTECVREARARHWRKLKTKMGPLLAVSIAPLLIRRCRGRGWTLTSPRAAAGPIIATEPSLRTGLLEYEVIQNKGKILRTTRFTH